jgi:hypothetical protein
LVKHTDKDKRKLKYLFFKIISKLFFPININQIEM